MARLGLCGETLRLPMTPMSRNLVPLVEGALKESGLLS
jgi:4-hydroxy-tetrahydrodipicolinate synthase